MAAGEEERGIIKIDGYLRESLGVRTGDLVKVGKVERVEQAQKVGGARES